MIPGQSVFYREIERVSLKKKMGDGHLQTTSSTLGNSLIYPIGVGPSYAICRLIKDEGHGIISNTYKGYRPERLAGGDLSL
jgi:hypothetical protein